MNGDEAGAGIPGGPLFFPAAPPTALPPQPPLRARVTAVPGLNRTFLSVASDSDIEEVLMSMVEELRRSSPGLLEQADGLSGDDLAIPSQVAVWLLGHVSAQFGTRLVNLAKVPDRNSLRSTRGLAALIHTAIRSRVRGRHR